MPIRLGSSKGEAQCVALEKREFEKWIFNFYLPEIKLLIYPFKTYSSRDFPSQDGVTNQQVTISRKR